jgi:hypothetical protein
MIVRRICAFVAFLVILLATVSCSKDNRLESIQVLPADPTILNNNSVYVTPGGIVQYQIQGWYSGRTASTAIPSSQGKWTSTQPSVASVDSNGLVTSAGPVGTTTIVVTVNERKSTTALSVCLLSSLCPPVCTPTSCP